MMRVIVNGVSFYTTPARVVRGVGSDSTINMAVQTVYRMMKKTDQGLATRVAVYDHKMQQQYFEVQINR
jgi:hypothetical protein